MHIVWSSRFSDILSLGLQTNWLHASRYTIINLRLITRHHLVLLMRMLSLRNHHWLYELYLLLPRLSIHSHLLRINRLHLKRLAVLVEVTRNLDSILRILSLAIRGLIDNLYGLLRHTWSLISLSHYL